MGEADRLERNADAPGRTVRVGMIGLGCAKNVVDGEVMLGRLVRAGFAVTPDPEQAEVVVVNTCGFIVDAKKESIDAILEVAEAKRRGRVRRLVVSGCMAQAYAAELLQEIPEIDAFVGLDELEGVVAAVRGERNGRIPDQRAAIRLYGHGEPRLVSTPGYAYLKVAEGCDNPCAFCLIPRMRGRFRSRPLDDLVAEARALEAKGVGELVLVAQDTTRYGQDIGLEGGLRRLVERLLEETGIPWIRSLYAYPTTLDEGLFELMASSARFVSYLDLPFQHASRRVLQAMRRGGDARLHAALVDRARAAVPDLVVRTTFIVGFPGEGEAELEELLDFVRLESFDHVGVFAYSWQEENPGAELGDPVPAEVKEERRQRVLEVQQEISLRRNRALVGRRLPALIEGRLEEMELVTHARLQRQAPEVDGRLLLDRPCGGVGDVVEAEIIEAHPYDLVGTPLGVLHSARAVATALPVRG